MQSGNISQVLIHYKLYLSDIKKVSNATIGAYMTDLSKFADFIQVKFDIALLSDLNPSILRSYILNMKNSGKASSSISRSVSVIKNFMLYCYHEDVIEDNLSDIKLELPKEKKKLPEVLTVEEINILLSQPEDTLLGIRDRAMLETLYTSGLKVNELIHLRLNDVNLKLKVINCKSKSGNRLLPLGAIAQGALENYMSTSRPQLVTEDCEYLFVSYNGKAISRQGFWKLVKKYAVQAGIKKNISTSTFRHSFATHMIQNGINKDVLREALGNSSVASVQMYLDLNRKRQKL